MAEDTTRDAIRRRMGDRIAVVRRARGIALDDLAGRVGLATARLARFETGDDTLIADDLVAIAAVLGVTLEFGFGMDSPIERRDRPSEPVIPLRR